MLELSRSWWILAVRGAAAVIFGLLALIWPQITLLALVLVFGAYAFIDGVFALVAPPVGGSWPAAAAAGWSLRACSASAPASSRSSGPASPPWPCCG